MSEPRVEGWDITYRTIPGHFRFCMTKKEYCGSFIYMGDICEVRAKGYDNFIAKWKERVDNILGE